MLSGVKDLDYKILNELDDKDLINACQTNKAADKICTDQNFWLNRIQIKFPYLSYDILDKNRKNKKWSDYYIELIKINPLNRNTYLVDGTLNDRSDYVLVALNKGADPNSSSGRRSVLTQASMKGYLNIVKILVENGAAVNLKDDYDVTAIYKAAEQGHLDIIKYLIEHGAILYPTIGGATPLMAAAHQRKFDVVKYLLDLVPDINFQSRMSGNTALHFAVMSLMRDKIDNLNIVKLLLEKGADPNIRNIDGFTPLELAINRPRIIEILKEYGAH